MNVNDFPDVSAVPSSKQLEFIFATQRALRDKYDFIEESNGFHTFTNPSGTANLHDKKDQAHLKDMAWRVMEEVGEALEAFDTHKSITHIHVHEELADGLHFMVELCIKAGMDYQPMFTYFHSRNKELFDDTFDEVNPLQFMSQSYYELPGFGSAGNPLVAPAVLTRELGRAMNCLKNKPWKQSHMLTDIPRFNHQIYLSLIAYLVMMHDFGLSSQEIFNIYFRKSKVNEFRQRTNY